MPRQAKLSLHDIHTGRSLVATGSYTLNGVEVVFGIEVSPEGSFSCRFTRRDGYWLIARDRIFKQ